MATVAAPVQRGRERSVAGRSRPKAHRVGRARHARSAGDPRALREGEAAGRHADVGLSCTSRPRPPTWPGRSRPAGPICSSVPPTRCRPRTTSRPAWSRITASRSTPSRARTSTAITGTSPPPCSTQPNVTMDDGADLVSAMIFIALDRLDDVHTEVRKWAATLSPAERKELVGQRRRQHGRDDDGRDPAAGDGEGRRAQAAGHRRQRRPDQALLRQPLRHGPEHDRRRDPRDRHAAGRPPGRGLRLRLVRQGRGAAGPRHGLARDRHRDRPDPRPRGRDGRLPGQADRRGRHDWATSSSPSPATST